MRKCVYTVNKVKMHANLHLSRQSNTQRRGCWCGCRLVNALACTYDNLPLQPEWIHIVGCRDDVELLGSGGVGVVIFGWACGLG